MTWTRDPGSFKDPAGFVFSRDGVVYRQVNLGFAESYLRLVDSGLYASLTRDRLLVRHEEVDVRLSGAPPAHAVLKPEHIPFISYPYEWSFGQLKAAALLTLEVQKRALAHGLVLRDASAYNVQFVGPRPIFIDTLSFGPHVEGQPWVAYRQFCQHFLAPLALMALTEPSLGDLAQLHVDGVPLGLATSLLPLGSRLRPGLLLHLHLHGRAGASQNASATRSGSSARAMGKKAMLGLVDSLERTVRGLSWKPPATVWSTYSDHLNYSAESQAHKRHLVAAMLDVCPSRPDLVWDLGANTGEYSGVAARHAAHVVSFDSDRVVVEQHFDRVRLEENSNILPLVQNLLSPSPAVGWSHEERRSLEQRGPADVALALALEHHLAIGGNVPMESVADFFGRVCRRLIIEFVPKEDSQVQRMLATREDVFPDYTQEAFEHAFASRFMIQRSEAVEGTLRRLYLMSRR
jgi:ribosomal protein L11 methylase PrmA